MDKTNFLLYKDFKPNVDILSDEQAGKLFKAVFQYVQDRTEPDFTSDGMLLMAFTMLKTTLERDLKKYKKQVEINRTNGKKGGRPPKEEKKTQLVNDKPKEPNGLNENPNNPSEPKKADSDSVTDSDSVIDIDTDKKDKDTMVNYDEIKTFYNSLNNLPNIRTLSTKRKDKIRLRIKEVGLEEFKTALQMCNDIPFLNGSNGGTFIGDLDWVIKNDENILKVLEGKYGDKTKPKTQYEKEQEQIVKDRYSKYKV